jgi:hypothetical protein
MIVRKAMPASSRIVGAVAVAVWQAPAKRRTDRLRGQFGPEYDRVVDTAESRREAEAELAAREERRDRLEIRPLPQPARDRYVETWQAVQAQFVDEPRVAVVSADMLIQSVMSDRGYPVEDFDQRVADISVDHPQVVENHCEGHRLSEAAAGESGSTEDLGQAMGHFFEELVEPDADEALERDRADSEPAAERDADAARGRTVG